MKKIKNGYFTGERALFSECGAEILSSVFENGESPLKESRDIYLENCIFKWKYPLWYSENIVLKGGAFTDTARAGVWYTKNIEMADTLIEAPKTFRRSEKIALCGIQMPNAEETLWECKDVNIKNLSAKGDYFALNISDADIDSLVLTGNYPFDGAKNLTIRNSRLLSKDAFWNTSDVTVYDSFISGEYLGWNSKNLTLINCTLESHQALCYAENLVLINCRIMNTDLAFEYSTLKADLKGYIDSIKNPLGGSIKAEKIGEIIMEEDKVDPEKTVISEVGSL